MFKTFFLTELKYVLKQPMIYIFLFIISLLVFGAVASDNVIIGGSVGNVFKNSPKSLTIFTSILSIFGLVMATAFFNNAALRENKYNFNEILFSAPINKSGYFFGRFFGALILSTIPLLGVFIGAFLGAKIGVLMNWVAPERIGPFYFETFTNNYLLIILPNMFLAGAIIFALATKTKSTIISFVGALIIIIGYLVSGQFISDIDNETLAALTDAFGIRAYSLETKYFTPLEQNTISPSFSGLLFLNRLVWMAVGFVILLLSYFNFSFKEKAKKVKAVLEEKITSTIATKKPILKTSYTGNYNFNLFKSFFKTNYLSITKNVVFKILFLFSAIILISSLWGGYEYFGLQSYPVTYQILETINNSTSIFIYIIIVFFSGELVWRDRDFNINEVIDATPYATIYSLTAKFLSLISIASLLYFFFIICGIIYQAINGYTNFEIGVYLQSFLYNALPGFLIFSGVLILIQVISKNKYIGYFISILIIFFWDLILLALDIQSNMLILGVKPSLQYSDMNWFGPGFKSAMWFNFYWILLSVICLFFAAALWQRGMLSSLKNRFTIANKQTSKGFKLATAFTIISFLGVAAFVFYNTQILNDYDTTKESETSSASFEKKYKQYENLSIPKITDAKYFIDIFPEKREVNCKVEFGMINKSETAIDSLFISFNEDWNQSITFENATVVFEDEDLEVKIYKFDPPLQPNQKLTAIAKSAYNKKGISNTRPNTTVLKNGTFFNNFAILPTLGYRTNFELQDKNSRRKYDLKPKKRMPELESNCSKSCMANYLSDGTSDYINIETVISTSEDQIAIAPGSLINETLANGRKTFHYKVDHPSQHFCSFVSARYEVARKKWNGVDVEIYHDKKHTVNIEMMTDAVERSLKYFTENFGPYYHKQCRIIEFPRYATFAQAFPGTMPYSEGFGFITNLEDEEENNVIDAVIAHEIAHQWWAHQVVGADMQGGTLMSESFAEYSSLMTMKQISKTPMKMREFLKYDHDRYLRGRSREVDKELPLYKVENQDHIHYGKGSVILYALQDYIGEEKVNAAMRNFLSEFKYKEPPYPTSYDFLKHLEPEVPDSLKYLVDDWFKTITLYDNRLEKATYKKLEDEKYEISLNIKSNKIKADTIGNETKEPINDWIDIGVFADSDEKDLMFQKRVKFDEPEMTFSFVVDKLPEKAAIDPRRLLIERVYKDNIKNLEEMDN